MLPGAVEKQPRSLYAYPDDFAMLDRADDPSARFHMRQQVLNAVRLGADNQNSDASPGHILLVLDAPV